MNDIPTTLRSIAKRVQWEDKLNEAADAFERCDHALTVAIRVTKEQRQRIAELEAALEMAKDDLTGDAWIAADLVLSSQQ